MRDSRQLRDLIKNKANELNVNPQLLLKRYFMEQMLERISSSNYSAQFILKGGMLISSIIGEGLRTTRDIDITLKNIKLDKREVNTIFEEIIKIDLNDKLDFTMISVEDIHEEFEYPGVRATFEVKMEEIKDSFKIDITTGDVITPKEIEYGYVKILEDKQILIFSYPVETILAEKIESIISKNIIGTRMRDFYDVYMLDKLHSKKLKNEILKEAFANTIEKRNSTEYFQDVEDIIAAIEMSETLQNLWKNYANKNPYVDNVSFEDTIISIKNLIKRVVE